MNWLDFLLLAVAILYGVTGWFRGFVVNVSEVIGLVGGSIIGITSAPIVFDRFWPSGPIWAISFVLIMALLGQYFMRTITRGLVPSSATGNFVNRSGGLVISVAGVLVAAWALGYALARADVPGIATVARDSRVLAAVDSVMPDRASDALRTFSDHLANDVLPTYLQPFEREIIEHVDPPDRRVLAGESVQAAAASIVKVAGYSRCTRLGATGSGFMIAPNRVMTNAHVVSGVDDPAVTINGVAHAATVVYFDPRVDVAVLDVPGAHEVALEAAPKIGSRGDDAVVMGFPGGGPFDAEPARIRNVVKLRGSDIYDREDVVRESFSLRSLVRAGNSGGPLLSLDGKVLGMVFASSITDMNTGYALTANQIAQGWSRGLSATESVETMGC